MEENSGLARLRALHEPLRQRAKVIAAVRHFLESRGSLEVETPALVRAPGTDVELDPWRAGHRFLITSPEFHMKRLIGAGLGRIHQICHCFRVGEAGIHHNPEFTMLEWYWPGVGYLELADELEVLLTEVALSLRGTTKLPKLDVDLEPPWERLTVRHAFERYAGWTPGRAPDPDRFFLDLVDKVEPNLGKSRPTVLYEYPASQAALSRLDPKNHDVAMRFEVYVAGIELVNAFDELTDADEQRARFIADNEMRASREKPTLPVDHDLLEALAAMPPTAGAALGIDRLVMLLLELESLNDVMAFPVDAL